jgi:DNA repair protein RadC
MNLYEFEIKRKCSRIRQSAPIVRDAIGVAHVARTIIGDIDHEVMIVLHLDVKNRVRGYHEAGRGGLAFCSVDPMQVFRTALMAGARAIVLVHNHPSGDPSPSPEDMALTRRLVDGGALLGVQVLDHVILGDEHHFFSLLCQDLMPKAA